MARRTNPASISNWNNRGGEVKSDGTLKDDYYAGVIDPDIPGVNPGVEAIMGDPGTEGEVDTDGGSWVARKRK